MGIEPTSEAWEENRTFTQLLHFPFFPNLRKTVLLFARNVGLAFRGEFHKDCAVNNLRGLFPDLIPGGGQNQKPARLQT